MANKKQYALSTKDTTISIDRVVKLKKFLDSKKTDSAFPSISVFPDMLGSVLSFVNERKMMKIEQQQFSAKMNVMNNYIDKSYAIAIERINKNTEMQLASIKGDVQSRLYAIDRQFDSEIRRIERDYDLKREEMTLYYDMIEKYRKDQERRFNRIRKDLNKQRGEMVRAIREMEAVTKHLQSKITNGTATPQEMDYFMLVMQFRVESINNMDEAICKLAGRIK